MKVQTRSASGFTLIELLVVVSIVALLIALLLPAISQARDAAAKMMCMSNLKQISIPLALYEDDHRAYPRPERDRYDYMVTDTTLIGSNNVPRVEMGLSALLYQDYLQLTRAMFSPSHKETNVLVAWYGPGWAGASRPYVRAGGYCYTPHTTGAGDASGKDIKGMRDKDGPLVWDTPPDFIASEGGLFRSFYAHIHDDGWHGLNIAGHVRWVPDEPGIRLHWGSGHIFMDDLFRDAR